MMTKVFTIAHMPDDLAHAWLQHLRDFDTAHPGCHFQVVANAPDATMAQMLEALNVVPAFSTIIVGERKKRD